VGIANFLLEGFNDVVMRNAPGNVGYQQILNDTAVWRPLGDASGAYTAVGIGDFSGDGISDILMRDAAGNFGYQVVYSSNVMVWHPTPGSALAAGGSLSSDPSWAVVGVGDFNNDGISDVMLRNSQGRMGYEQIANDTMVWHPTPSAGLAAGGVVSSDPSYTVVGIGDFNRDGTSDVMMRNAAGLLGYQTISGDVMTWHPLGTTEVSYSVVGIGDFNRDGVSDVMMRNSSGVIGFYQVGL
jgi:hypothetical protein